jgi:polyhydroxyalkanoate synthesis regulator phasin
MPTKKRVTTARRTARRGARIEGRLRTGARTAGARIRGAWADAVDAVTTAQTNLEAGVKKLLRRNKISTKDAASMLRDLRALAERERRKAAKQVRKRMAGLQARVEKERKAAARTLDDGMRSALGALNIPSHSEVAALTRKVDELSRKVGRMKR